MSTLGYGDHKPITTDEKLFAIFAMIIASFVFGYYVGNISDIITKQGEK